jgi:hypothetical protein
VVSPAFHASIEITFVPSKILMLKKFEVVQPAAAPWYSLLK